MQAEANRVSNISAAQWESFNTQNARNQAQYCRNQGLDSIEEQYLTVFDNFDEKVPLEEHPFFQSQQKKFRDDISAFKMAICSICCEQWPMQINQHISNYVSLEFACNGSSTPQFGHANDTILKRCFQGIAQDSNALDWDKALHLFFDDRSDLEFDINRLKSSGNPIACLDTWHNRHEAKSKDLLEANGLHAQLFLCKGANVMLTSNLCTAVGLHNGARGRVEDFVYMSSEGPRHPLKQLPEAMVVEFSHLHE